MSICSSHRCTCGRPAGGSALVVSPETPKRGPQTPILASLPLPPTLQACALDKRSALPRLGSAQMYCASGQLVNAATELEEALQAAPAFYDALKVP